MGWRERLGAVVAPQAPASPPLRNIRNIRKTPPEEAGSGGFAHFADFAYALATPESGPGASAGWEEKVPTIAPEVACGDCRSFAPTKIGDPGLALGLCKGQPHDGHRGQWPARLHPCRGFRARVIH
jgi:hypothetical protein